MITYDHVTKKDKEIVLLDDISFQIKDYSIVCFLGKSDVGKTELFKSFIDNNRIDSGSIDMGLNIHNEKNKIAVVFRDFEENVGLSVLEYLQFYAKCLDIALKDSDVNDLLYKFKLNIYKNVSVDRLNKSTKRLLALAKAMLSNSDVLILESPMSDINDNVKRIIKDILIESIGKKTIIYTANNLMELGDICSHCGVLENGKLLMYGEIEDILLKMQLSMMIELKVLTDEDENKALQLLKADDRVKYVLLENGQIVFAIDGNIEDESNVLKMLLDNGIQVYSYSKDMSSYDFSLENIDNFEKDMLIEKEEF